MQDQPTDKEKAQEDNLTQLKKKKEQTKLLFWLSQCHHY